MIGIARGDVVSNAYLYQNDIARMRRRRFGHQDGTFHATFASKRNAHALRSPHLAVRTLTQHAGSIMARSAASRNALLCNTTCIMAPPPAGGGAHLALLAYAFLRRLGALASSPPRALSIAERCCAARRGGRHGASTTCSRSFHLHVTTANAMRMSAICPRIKGGISWRNNMLVATPLGKTRRKRLGHESTHKTGRRGRA